MALLTEVLSQGQFRDLRPDPKWAVVAILNHDEIYPPPTDGYAAALELMFDDVGDGALSWWQRFSLNRVTSVDAVKRMNKQMDASASQDPWPAVPWHAAELKRFTLKLKRKHPNLEGVRLYCEYGKSRSPMAAIAMEHWWKSKPFTVATLDPKGEMNDRWAKLLVSVP